MRLFIAIDFNELKDYFNELQKLLPQAKLSFANSFHLTLKFLGEVQPNDVDAIIKSLKNVKFSPFSVSLDSIGVFPNEEFIRVIWVDLKPEEKVMELQKQIDDSLKDVFKKEKDFKSHVTIARVKFLGNAKEFVEKLKNIKVENRKIEVKNFRLVKSTLAFGPPVYEDIAIF